MILIVVTVVLLAKISGNSVIIPKEFSDCPFYVLFRKTFYFVLHTARNICNPAKHFEYNTRLHIIIIFAVFVLWPVSDTKRPTYLIEACYLKTLRSSRPLW